MRLQRLRAPKVSVKVTTELIEGAVPRDSGHCMFAESVKAAFPNARYVSVDLQTIRFTDPAKHLRYTYLTPRTCQIALVDFDLGVKPEPFDFQLRNGQVTAAGARNWKLDATGKTEPRQPVKETKGQSAQRRKALLKANLAKARLVKTGSGRGDSVPDRIGGRTPPMGSTPFARRRAFGLRALAR